MIGISTSGSGGRMVKCQSWLCAWGKRVLFGMCCVVVIVVGMDDYFLSVFFVGVVVRMMLDCV
jgi:hypothetical protein